MPSYAVVDEVNLLELFFLLFSSSSFLSRVFLSSYGHVDKTGFYLVRCLFSVCNHFGEVNQNFC